MCGGVRENDGQGTTRLMLRVGGYAGCAWGMEARDAVRCNGGALGSMCRGYGFVPKIG